MAPIRLIDVNTMRLADENRLAEEKKRAKENNQVIKYGILSHRWLPEEDEVHFEDLKAPHIDKPKKGLAKITQTCVLAQKEGLSYVWLDTCCINKNNTAELQESINSMYRWYQESTVCFAYLDDTDATSPGSMANDKWFTRGWTLQELIAPRRVEFYDRSWQHLGDKNDLKDVISTITKVDIAVLSDPESLYKCSVAARLSWASERETKKDEDRSYSLMGLLGVNMPTLYGEGEENSFRRLQEEVIKTSDDHSIFAWKGLEDGYPGLLADSLDKFRNCQSIKLTQFRKGKGSFSMTNRGMSITLTLTQWTLDTYLARIHCVDMADSRDKNIENGMTGVFLRRLKEDDQYARIRVDGVELVHDLRPPLNWTKANFSRHSREVPIFVRQAQLTGVQYTNDRVFGFRLGDGALEYNSKKEKLFSLLGTSQGRLWVESEKTLTLQPGLSYFGVVAHLDISKQGKAIKQIKLCFDFDFNPILLLAESNAIDAKEKPLLTSSGQINTASERTYSEQERHRWLSFGQRSPYDTLAWNAVNDTSSSASRNMIRDGLWQLRGDRINGLDVLLGGTKIRVSLKRVTTEFGRECWELRFDNMPVSKLKKMFA